MDIILCLYILQTYRGVGSLMGRRFGSIYSAIWNSHSLKVPVNSDNNHSPLLSKAMHIGYIKMACRLLLLTRHCLRTCSFFLVLQTVHSFVGTLYLVFLLLVINSTMAEFCCLKYFFFFCSSNRQWNRNKCDVPQSWSVELSYGWVDDVSRAMKFLLCLWHSAIGIITPELSNPENEGTAVPT